MTTRSRRIWLIAGVATVLGLVVVGFLVWWFVFRDDSPPPPDIESQSAAIAEEQNLQEPEATPEETTTTAAPAAEPDTVAGEEELDDAEADAEAEAADADSGISGTWVVDSNLGSFEDFTSSFAGYRVQEELAGIGGSTAVGRTPEVSGELEIDGTTISSAEVVVDMASLESDSIGRDGRVRGALEVDQFPTASFELTTPIAFSEVPLGGELLTVQATGDFTAHGITRPVIVDIEANLVGEVIVVVGSFEIAFDDYGVTPPTAVRVLSVADVATVEWQLNFTREP